MTGSATSSVADRKSPTRAPSPRQWGRTEVRSGNITMRFGEKWACNKRRNCAAVNKTNPLWSKFQRGFGPRWETRTPGLMVPNVCRNLQSAIFRPLWPFPLLGQFLFRTLLPCLFQETLSPFGICVGLDSVY